MTMNRLSPITPGELLDQEFLGPLGISLYRLAKAIGVPASRISESAPLPCAGAAGEQDKLTPRDYFEAGGFCSRRTNIRRW